MNLTKAQKEKLLKDNGMKNQTGLASEIFTKGALTPEQAGKLSATCLQSLMKSIPPEFCWKPKGDAGVLPSECPKNFTRNGALCYENCKEGYKHVGGVCWQKCNKTLGKDIGAFCAKSVTKWHRKKSYIPRFKTNFDPMVGCPMGKYKPQGAALCYKDCALVGMYNCGIGSCVRDKSDCAAEISTMVVDTMQGVVDAVSFVLSFGTSSGAAVAKKQAIKQGLEQVGEQAAKKSTKAAFKSLTSKFGKHIMESAADLAKDHAKEFILEKGQQLAVSSFCQTVYDGFLPKFKSDFASWATVVDAIDILGVQGTIKACSNTKADAGVGCAKSVVGAASNFDPTGLMTIAATFMNPSCKWPSAAKKYSKKAEIETVLEGTVDEDLKIKTKFSKLDEHLHNCVVFFNETGYEGQAKAICLPSANLTKDISFEPKSFLTGENVRGSITDSTGE